MGKVVALIGEAVEVAVSGNTTVFEMELGGEIRHIWFEVNNSGAKALDAFALQARAHPDGAWVTIASTWAVGGIMTIVSAALETLAAVTKATVLVQIDGPSAIRMIASANTAVTTVTIEGMGLGY